MGRFITPDTIVQAPSNPQTLNRYTYCNNNPVNLIDPTGHKWSWKKFWHAAVGAIVGVVAAFVLGPVALGGIGFFSTAWGAASFGGALGGAITGGLDGGWRGALIGGALGGVVGGLGGWGYGVAAAHKMIGQYVVGSLVIGGGIAAATGNMDSFAGGLAGSLAGMGVNYELGSSKAFNGWRLKVHNRDRMWVGVQEDVYQSDVNGSNAQKQMIDKSQHNPRIDFKRDPSVVDLKEALQSGYHDVILSTHGTPKGVLLSDGNYHSLNELGNIVGSINASNFVVGSCSPGSQAAAWNSLGVRSTNYIEIGAAAYGPHFSRAPIGDVNGEAIDGLLNQYIYGKH